MSSKPTPQFLALIATQSHDEVYRAPRIKGDGPALTVLAINSPGVPEEDWYYYSQRVGKDSVAFLLYDQERDQYQCLSQFHGPLARYVPGAFTGSMDKEGLSPHQITIEEVAEEAGYEVTNDFARVLLLGKEPVSSQTSEEVNLFVVDITGLPQRIRAPENIYEDNITRFWFDGDAIIDKLEWKAKLIVLKHRQYLAAQETFTT